MVTSFQIGISNSYFDTLSYISICILFDTAKMSLGVKIHNFIRISHIIQIYCFKSGVEHTSGDHHWYCGKLWSRKCFRKGDLYTLHWPLWTTHASQIIQSRFSDNSRRRYPISSKLSYIAKFWNLDRFRKRSLLF